LLKLTGDIVRFSSPFLLGKIVEFISSYAPHAHAHANTHAPLPAASASAAAAATPVVVPLALWTGCLYAGGLMFAAAYAALASTHYSLGMTRVSMCVRAATLTAVAAKALRLSPAARRKFTAGHVTNVMSNDANSVQK
jgi:hypothetical protein